MGLKLATKRKYDGPVQIRTLMSVINKQKEHNYGLCVFRTRLRPRFGRAPRTCPCAVKVVATPP